MLQHPPFGQLPQTVPPLLLPQVPSVVTGARACSSSDIVLSTGLMTGSDDGFCSSSAAFCPVPAAVKSICGNVGSSSRGMTTSSAGTHLSICQLSAFRRVPDDLLSVAGTLLTSETSMIESWTIFAALKRDMLENDVGRNRCRKAERDE
jgi:hypothetical protein